jgi:quercetin dioxygenase-like cupin family protein
LRTESLARKLALLLAVPACGQAGPPAEAARKPEVVAVYEEPRHRVLYQNPLVWVVELHLPPGDTTAWHYHPVPLVGIAVQGGRFLDQDRGGSPRPISPPSAAPYVFDNWSRTIPYTHRVINADTVPIYDVFAEWHGPSNVQVAALPDTPNRRLIKNGKTALVYEIRLAPGDSTEAHTHAAPGLTVLGTDGTLSDSAQPEAKGGSGAGAWSWRSPGYRHVLKNDGGDPLIVYEIDWR